MVSVYWCIHGIPRALGCSAYLSVWQEVGVLCVERLAVFVPSLPTLCFPLCISVTGACLLAGMGAHGWVVRFCQPLVQSPSLSWLPIVEAPGCLRHPTSTERRSCLFNLSQLVSTQVSLGQVQNTGHRSLFHQYRNNPNHLQVLTLGLKTFA